MTTKTVATFKVGISALAVLTFATACGSVADTASTDGEAKSEVVSGEETAGKDASKAEVEEADEATAELKVADYGFTQLPAGEYGSPPGVSYGVVIKNSLPGQSESLEGKEPANFTVSKVNTRAHEFGGLKTTATVESPFTKDLKDLKAVAIYRDKGDKIIGGSFTFLNFVPAGGKASLSIDSLSQDLTTPASTDVYIAMSSLTLLD